MAGENIPTTVSLPSVPQLLICEVELGVSPQRDQQAEIGSAPGPAGTEHVYLS